MYFYTLTKNYEKEELRKQSLLQKQPKGKKNLGINLTKEVKYLYIENYKILMKLIYKERGASLVAQQLRICLLMQGTRVRALVWEDPTCRGATRPMSHNY